MFGFLWKLSIDILLPTNVPEFEVYLGTVENRNPRQRFIWILLLEMIHIFIEVFAFSNYYKLNRSLKMHLNSIESKDDTKVKKNIDCSLFCGQNWRDRVKAGKFKKMSAAADVRIMRKHFTTVKRGEEIKIAGFFLFICESVDLC